MINQKHTPCSPKHEEGHRVSRPLPTGQLGGDRNPSVAATEPGRRRRARSVSLAELSATHRGDAS